jgi:hypothetical protein
MIDYDCLLCQKTSEIKKMKISKKPKKLLNKGFKGYPVATIAYYGPGDKNATKDYILTYA